MLIVSIGFYGDEGRLRASVAKPPAVCYLNHCVNKENFNSMVMGVPDATWVTSHLPCYIKNASGRYPGWLVVITVLLILPSLWDLLLQDVRKHGWVGPALLAMLSSTLSLSWTCLSCGEIAMHGRLGTPGSAATFHYVRTPDDVICISTRRRRIVQSSATARLRTVGSTPPGSCALKTR